MASKTNDNQPLPEWMKPQFRSAGGKRHPQGVRLDAGPSLPAYWHAGKRVTHLPTGTAATIIRWDRLANQVLIHLHRPIYAADIDGQWNKVQGATYYFFGMDYHGHQLGRMGRKWFIYAAPAELD